MTVLSADSLHFSSEDDFPALSQMGDCIFSANKNILNWPCTITLQTEGNAPKSSLL